MFNNIYIYSVTTVQYTRGVCFDVVLGPFRRRIVAVLDESKNKLNSHGIRAHAGFYYTACKSN